MVEMEQAGPVQEAVHPEAAVPEPMPTEAAAAETEPAPVPVAPETEARPVPVPVPVAVLRTPPKAVSPAARAKRGLFPGNTKKRVPRGLKGLQQGLKRIQKQHSGMDRLQYSLHR